jgi:hypothetical protein
VPVAVEHVVVVIRPRAAGAVLGRAFEDEHVMRLISARRWRQQSIGRPFVSVSPL